MVDDSSADPVSATLELLKTQAERIRESMAEPVAAGDPALLDVVIEEIRRRRRSEADLARAREWIDLAQELGGVGAYEYVVATGELTWSPSVCALFGLPADATPSLDVWLGAVHPADRDAVMKVAQAAIEHGETVQQTYRVIRPDGGIRWIDDRGRVLCDAKGRPERIVGLNIDVTDRATQHDERERLQETELRFRALLETMETAFALVEVKFDENDIPVDYRFIEANPAFERQAGVNLRGKWVTEFAPQLERFWFETYGHVAKTGEPATFENYAEAFGRWFEVRAVRVGHPSERQIAIFFTDSTARRLADDRLRESEARARAYGDRVQLALAAGAIIGTWVWDIPSDQFTVDEAFARSFGLDPVLVSTGLSLKQVLATVHPDDRPGLQTAIAEAIARGGAYAHQYRVRRHDGAYYWVEANGRVDVGPDGAPLSFPGVLIDIDESREIEAERDRATAALRELNETLEQRIAARTAELMEAEAQLRQSQKMEAVGQLTGGLAHDFNNLLAGISGSLELMSSRVRQGRITEVGKYLLAAQDAVRRAAALTHRLMAFSRRQTLDPKPTDVSSLAAGMLELIGRSVGPGISIKATGPADLWLTLVDQSQLENALLNLCINARDAMPAGGQITIETANHRFEGQDAHKHDVPAGDYVSLSVTDSGTGMPPEIVAKVFEPFFTTKPVGQGTGLGLSMIYGFVKQSEGQVRIDSEVRRGTTVCIYLPRHYGQAPVESSPSNRQEAPLPAAGGTVLIVDDEPAVRMLITELLKDLGYTTIEAADSIAGAKLLRSDMELDLLVTDFGLPGGLTGRELADLGWERRQNLKVLIVTGYPETATLDPRNSPERMKVLTKPFTVERLTDCIHELHQTT